VRIATWNVNSIRQRMGHLAAWLEQARPDVVALQELKCRDDAFPAAEVRALGYHAAVHGQPAYNGVALLSRHPLEEVRRGLPGATDDLQARYLEARISSPSGPIRVASLYLPNGNPAGTEKYAYKMAWMDRLAAHARSLLAEPEPLVLAGDYNVIPAPADVHDPEAWAGDALFLPETRARFQALLGLGLVDALRAKDDRPGVYTYFDYQAGAWRRKQGLRIDHLLLSPGAAARLQAVEVDVPVRGWERPSDHVPVRIDLQG
jgi:exodeoxyribonuclease-3